ncbi:Mu1-adaptin [Dunaliella salina]|uniref:Mu1-adaptin n=1 Tax=Dunaliella salina TaxID=3046 RepID=A0ABQ7GFN7_DUNSA|nr:Mu1-adaptin [Dunaliella salina]|eukprot:KAF5833389.1 Mu1-adaptin [Dunaliella salina]
MSGAVSALFFLDVKGRVILHRDYRGDVSPKVAERFMNKLNELEEVSGIAPIICDEGITYIYTQVSNLYLLAVTRSNVNAATVVVFLHRLIGVFKHYFQNLEEESLRDNFVIAYELLDEVMDFGYPQFTEAAILSEYIKTDAHKMEVQVKPPMAVTNAVSWRKEGIKHKKNEVFLDAVESINLLVNSNGSVVSTEVSGVLKMRTFLSGMPECKLGLNDKVLFENQGRTQKQKTVELEDVKFHQCVRLARFENDRTISFIPPDGAFDLMSYRLSQNIKPLIAVDCKVEKPSRSRTEYLVKARSQFKERSCANNVEIMLPLPFDATAPTVKTTAGFSTYVPEKSALKWTLKSFPGGKEYVLRCHFSLPSVEAEDDNSRGKMPPIKVQFEIPYFTVSGIQVRYLKVIEKSGYQALPWVRYITQAGNYELRLAN